MKRIKTREEKLWDYLSKKIGNTSLAKQVHLRICKEFKSKTSEVTIKYNIDVRPLKDSLKVAKSLTKELSKISISK